MPYAGVNDIQMYYDDLGSGQPVVLLNGATGTNSTTCGALRDTLAQNYRVLHIEHRGHGRTNNPAGYLAYDLIASDVIALIEQLELGPVHVIGHSDGGIVTLVIGMTRPDLVRSLVPIGANYYNDEQVLQANAVLSVENIEQKPPHEVEQFAQAHDPHHHPGYWKTLINQLAENLAVNPRYNDTDLGAITAPTLLITGETDLWCNIDQILGMRRAIPSSEMLIVNHAGRSWMANHDVQDERPEVVMPAILEFLARLTPADENRSG